MKVIVLDAGHGGTDPGAVGNGIKEADINLRLTQFITLSLRNYDVMIYLTRDGDKTVSLLQRLSMIKKWKPHAVLSIHCNSVTDSKANGYETFRRFDHSLLLQAAVHSEVIKVLQKYGIRDRQLKVGNYIILNSPYQSVLTENLFVSNPKEAGLLKDNIFLQELARAYVLGLERHLQLARRGGGGDKLDVT